MPQEEINRLLVEHAPRGQRGRAAQGRRPVRVRPRRRGGARAAPRRDPVRGRAGRHRGRRRARLRRHPRDAPRPRRAVAFVTGHEDPDKPETALDWPALAALPGNARLLHGRARAAADRRAAGRRRARARTSRPRSWSAGRCRGQRTRAGDARRRGRARRGRGDPRARDHARRRRSRRCASSSRWLERRPLHGRSVAVTRARRAGERARRAPARARRRGGRGAGDPHRAARRPRCRIWPATTSSA